MPEQMRIVAILVHFQPVVNLGEELVKAPGDEASLNDVVRKILTNSQNIVNGFVV